MKFYLTRNGLIDNTRLCRKGAKQKMTLWKKLLSINLAILLVVIGAGIGIGFLSPSSSTDKLIGVYRFHSFTVLGATFTEADFNIDGFNVALKAGREQKIDRVYNEVIKPQNLYTQLILDVYRFADYTQDPPGDLKIGMNAGEIEAEKKAWITEFVEILCLVYFYLPLEIISSTNDDNYILLEFHRNFHMTDCEAGDGCDGPPPPRILGNDKKNLKFVYTMDYIDFGGKNFVDWDIAQIMTRNVEVKINWNKNTNTISFLDASFAEMDVHVTYKRVQDEEGN